MAAQRPGYAQVSLAPRRKCATMEAHHRLVEGHPDFRTALGDLEYRTRARFTSLTTFRAAGPIAGPIRIPVVVHVVYRSPEENIVKAQIDSQIDALNRDYSSANVDKANTPTCWTGLVTDPQIQFVLASKDPSGNATDGVTRTQTQVSSFATDDSIKTAATGGADPWPSDTYLNLWVCSLGGGILGYAQFPLGPAATDGVVILNTAFGTTGTVGPPFDLGRTATHECGHWLNLRHIWGDTEDCSGTDFVDDTPNAQHPNYGKPGFPHVSCVNGPNGDMFMNYMDYVDDDAMVMFSAGQVVRMHACLEDARKQLVTNALRVT